MTIIYISVDVLIISFYIVEGLLRKDKAAKSFKRTKFDKGSTYFLGFCLSISGFLIFFTPLLNRHDIGHIPTHLIFNLVGIGLILFGFYLRILAALTLGRFYTRTLRQVKAHTIVSKGIYGVIRNPGYLGDIILFIGAAIATGNWISIAVTVLFVISGYIYRITVEEKMLKESFRKKYDQYRAKTRRLVPFIY